MNPPLKLTVGHDLSVSADKWRRTVLAVRQYDGVYYFSAQNAPPAPEIHKPRIVPQIAEFLFDHFILASRTVHLFLLVLIEITWDPLCRV